jgi:NADP-dependent 3-hydroxy acid dehydrogenase YdfG
MLEVSEITDIIKWVLNLPHHIQIGELGVWVTDIRRETTLL